MLKFTRSFDNVVIRMIKGSEILYSAYDIATALNLEKKARAINEAVILENKKPESFIWDDAEVIFIPESYFKRLIVMADWDRVKRFVKWVDEVVEVAQSFTFYQDPEIAQGESHIAITQIAKKYGLSGQALNGILHDQQVQYKVNDQWVLYSKYQLLGLMKPSSVRKEDGSITYHSYWTEKGVNFIEQLLDKLGYEEIGKQMNLFEKTD